MSNSVRLHRQKPNRLPHPWDSPGKNTGVGCHFLLQYMKVKSESEVTQSSLTLSDPMDCSLPGSSVHGIFQARVLEWGATAFKVSLCIANYNHFSDTIRDCVTKSFLKFNKTKAVFLTIYLKARETKGKLVENTILTSCLLCCGRGHGWAPAGTLYTGVIDMLAGWAHMKRTCTTSTAGLGFRTPG